MAIYQFKREQRVKTDLNTLWEFISDPGNLKVITPPDLNFMITSQHPDQTIYPGMMITYRVSPLKGIRVTWVTEITHIEDKEYFIDEQRKGPYRIWHHEHRLKPLDKGTLMEDLITYAPPLGPLGAVANRLVIRRKLDMIFCFRENKLEEMFGNI